MREPITRCSWSVEASISVCTAIDGPCRSQNNMLIRPTEEELADLDVSDQANGTAVPNGGVEDEDEGLNEDGYDTPMALLYHPNRALSVVNTSLYLYSVAPAKHCSRTSSRAGFSNAAATRSLSLSCLFTAFTWNTVSV